MIKAFAAAFRTPDLRRKLLFTVAIMAIYRIGTFVPAPFVSLANVRECTEKAGDDGFLGMLNMFSGGAMLQLSVFALGIMPYITASIIIQLLGVVIPRFEQLRKEGQSGTAKLTEYTRYVTIGLALLQSSVFISLANTTLFRDCKSQIIPAASPMKYAMAVLAMTAGTGLIMWLAELITERGVGNGMSILIFTGICANFPGMLYGVVKSDGGWVRAVIVVTVFLAITAVVVFVEQCQRRVPVQYAKRVIGRRTIGGSTTYLPIKINMANVIPVIFASSLLMLPQMIASFGNQSSGWVQFIQSNLTRQGVWYYGLYALLIFGFTFFYTSITFDTEEVADNMKRYGGFIPGVRAGRPTAEYLSYVSKRVTWVGAIYLTVVALIPSVMFSEMGIFQGTFGGTSIMILVGVGLQTVKDINAQLQQRHYEGFLR